MDWTWQHLDWPHFRYRPDLLTGREAEFSRGSGVVAGAALHLADDERVALTIELMASEALKTSEIEGEILDRDSVQARHDLADLVALGALVRSGEYKATRYAVPFAIHGL